MREQQDVNCPRSAAIGAVDELLRNPIIKDAVHRDQHPQPANDHEFSPRRQAAYGR